MATDITRNTAQRRAILGALHEARGPLSVRALWSAARIRLPRLGIATVYRAIRALEAESLIRPVYLPGEPPRYETAARPLHAHFHCAACSEAFCLLELTALPFLITETGLRVESATVVLHGRCAACCNGGSAIPQDATAGPG